MHVIMDEFHSIFKARKERHLFLEIRAQSKHHIIQNSGHKPMMLFSVVFLHKMISITGYKDFNSNHGTGLNTSNSIVYSKILVYMTVKDLLFSNGSPGGQCTIQT